MNKMFLTRKTRDGLAVLEKGNIELQYFAPALAKTLQEGIDQLYAYEHKDKAGCLRELPAAVGEGVLISVENQLLTGMITGYEIDTKGMWIYCRIAEKMILKVNAREFGKSVMRKGS